MTFPLSATPALGHGLLLALAIGLLIGAERGWHQRDAAEGQRLLGVRSFALIGLLGGSTAALIPVAGAWPFAAALLGLSLLLAAARLGEASTPPCGPANRADLGLTTELAALATLALAGLAVAGEPLLAAAAAVAMAWLLELKSTLHRGLSATRPDEWRAVLKFALLFGVLLPVLPDQALGPWLPPGQPAWGSINPRQIGWLVVLLAGLSFAGYLAQRLLGPGRGVLLTGLLGGLMSSTAVTLTLARPDLGTLERPRVLAAIALAWAVMWLRIGVLVVIVAPSLFVPILPSLLAPALWSLVLVVRALRPAHATAAGGAAGADPEGPTRTGAEPTPLPAPLPSRPSPAHPLDLGETLRLALLLVGIGVAVDGLGHHFGQAGLIALAVLSGLADVDAYTTQVAPRVASLGSAQTVLLLLLAAATNTWVKAGLAGLRNRHLALPLLILALLSTVTAFGLCGCW